MAIFHLEIKTYGRNDSPNANAIRASAYRTGSRMRNEISGRVHDYRRKDEVVFSEITAPGEAAEWMTDRSRLWHAVEQVEKYRTARLFREFVLALPHELNRTQNIALVRDFVDAELTAMGMIIDWSLHEKPGNHHVHLSCPTRGVSATGFNKTKARNWDRKEHVYRWRKAWAETVNRHLALAGFDAERFVDHRTLAEQGIDRRPTVHVGRETPTTRESHARKVAYNRYVREVNAATTIVANAGQVDILRAEIETLQAGLSAAVQVLVKASSAPAAVPECTPQQGQFSQQAGMPSSNRLSRDDRVELAARTAFMQALGIRSYEPAQFMADCAWMAGEPGGSRLRWWLSAFRNAQANYPHAYGAALAWAPKDVSAWMGKCWDVLGETGTWEQFVSEERAQAARSRVAWPGDPLRAPGAPEVLAAGKRATAPNLMRGFGVRRSTATPVPRVGLDESRFLGTQREHPCVEARREGAPSPSATGMQVFERAVNSVVPDAEQLFGERQRVWRKFGRDYTWQNFHHDIRNLGDYADPQDGMLDWWRDVLKEAKDRGILDGEPAKTLFLRSIPRNVVETLRQQRTGAPPRSVVRRPEQPLAPDALPSAPATAARMTHDAALAAITRVGLGRDIAMAAHHDPAAPGSHRSSVDAYVPSAPTPYAFEYPCADLPVWVIPTLAPPDCP
jgi:hypothetical protein